MITFATTTLVAGLGVVAATSAHAATGCRVDYAVQSQWSGGFTANVEITNLGDPINGWSLAWAFSSGQQISQAWNAVVNQTGGEVTASNASYNPTIGTNGTVSFGFLGSWSGTNPEPGSFLLNGVECTGSVSQTTPPPVSPPPVSPPPTTPPPPPPSGDAMEVAAAMQPGWNLGNSLDATGADETSWGNPRITRELISTVEAQGYNSIRIPVTWGQHLGGAPSYTIEASYLNRVEEVVNWALDEDLYVMLNIHHDSWQWIANMSSDSTVIDRYNAIWTQVADRFQDAPPELLFESVNEPQFNGTSGDEQNYQLLDQLNTSFHEIVRGSGGNNANRMLVLPTLHTNAEQPRLDDLNSTIDALDDPNLIATVHYYGFWPFSVNIAGFTTFNAEVQQDLTGMVDRIRNSFINNGIPVIIGEYGLLGFDQHTGTIEQGEKLKFFEFFGYYTRINNVTTMLWDNGQHLNRNSLQWNDPEFFAQVQSSWTTRSGTASSDQVYVERSSSITSETLTLNLNGTTFQRLRHGNTNLQNGTDYTVSGNQLTLSASALTELTGSREYGVNANLHAEFSQGVPWRISVISYDTPILQNASGTTGSFQIPTQFRGDQLATMEAVYASGGIAGPQNWTSFKEFSYTFEPDYNGNVITLKPEFFAEVNDGSPVNLTFHFWSGETVTYSITKSGSNVTGTA